MSESAVLKSSNARLLTEVSSGNEAAKKQVTTQFREATEKAAKTLGPILFETYSATITTRKSSTKKSA